MSNYLENLMKEAKEYGKAFNKTSKNSSKGSSYPPNEMANNGKGREYYRGMANDAKKSEDAQFGQMLGALLQGRRYDDKTGKQIKKKAKGK
jgi:hypothetical protein